MNKIILTRGIQGSGKSTWAKAWVLEDPEHRIRINNDDITAIWGQPFGTKGLYERLKYFRKTMIQKFMMENLDIVVDNMNLSENSIQEIQGLVDFHNSYHMDKYYKMEYKDFLDVPLDVCIERDSKREKPIGKDIITQTYNKYIKNEN